MQSVWRGKPLRTLLDHVELAHYDGELINWKPDEQVYHLPLAADDSSESVRAA
jgi:hypothetical protein